MSELTAQVISRAVVMIESRSGNSLQHFHRSRPRGSFTYYVQYHLWEAEGKKSVKGKEGNRADRDRRTGKIGKISVELGGESRQRLLVKISVASTVLA